MFPTGGLAAMILVFGVFAGCATQHAPEGPAVNPVAADTVVVPTKAIKGDMGAAEDAQPSETPATPPPTDTAYRISPGDILSFRSFDDEKLSMEVVVRYDGCISLQMIPDLKVNGLTREEAEQMIREAYSAVYVEPQLTMAIVDAQGKTFTVMGEVASPREFPYIRPISILDAINLAGGLRVNQRGGDSFMGGQGQLVSAFIIRRDDLGRKVMNYDLRGFRKEGTDNPADTPVLPGDIVYVPEAQNLVYLLGEVGRPSVYAITEGLTLLRLLAQAGGFNESTSRISQVAITREINDTESQITMVDVRENMKEGKDFVLEPGDIIYVPRKKFVNAMDFVQRVTGPFSSAMGFGSQVMGLYQQAYSAWYTKSSYDLLYGNNANSSKVLLFDAIQGLSTIPTKQYGPNSVK
jgi:polysaccharide export outer membrane protein